MTDSIDYFENEVLFPDGLLSWAGHSTGGVKRPFQASSGRPTGDQIDTPLTLRLNKWVADLVCGNPVPNSIVLVGGPGNGKTDAVEGCIGELDKILNANGEILAEFSRRYSETQLAPRSVRISLGDVLPDISPHLNIDIVVVQDATEGDSASGKSAFELLLADMKKILSGDSRDIYICCVNRGILAEAATAAMREDSNAQATEMLNTVVRAVTTMPLAPDCWPLENYPHIAVWPMDVESLVEINKDGTSVAHYILSSALDESKWRKDCEHRQRCPFCQNRVLLSRKGAVDSLVTLLRSYELATAKRWTFRDLFSIVSYLLVGDFGELKVKGRPTRPCDWVGEQLRLSKNGNDLERNRAPFLLVSRLYYHRLFPNWPTFNRGEFRKAKSSVFKSTELDHELGAANGLFRFLAWSPQIAPAGNIPETVRESLGPLLDPALADSDSILFQTKDDDVSVARIEESFSVSVFMGYELVKNRVEVLERDVLELLIAADDGLAEGSINLKFEKQASLLRHNVRQYAARLSKRSLGARSGVYANSKCLSRYKDAISDGHATKLVRSQLREILLDGKGNFFAGLATTFGQPIAERSRNVELVLEKAVSISTLASKKLDGSDSRPESPLPYLSVDGRPLALTFELFKALENLEAGLLPASLPGEVYSLFDRVRSIVAGKAVRDEEGRILLSPSGDSIELMGGKFGYTKATIE